MNIATTIVILILLIGLTITTTITIITQFYNNIISIKARFRVMQEVENLARAVSIIFLCILTFFIVIISFF